MQRKRRMLGIGALTLPLTRELDHPSFRAALVPGMPAQVLGPAIAAHLDQVTLVDDALVIRVHDPQWRREVMRHRERLLSEARKLLEGIAVVRIEA